MKISIQSLAIAIAVVLLAVASTARAEMLVAHTSFEEPFVPPHPTVPGFWATTYTDPGDPAVDHPLMNVPDYPNPPVNYTSVGGELGFSAFYTNTRNEAGLTDGDVAGVINPASADLNSNILDPTDGVQYYVLSGVDGKVTVTLDGVDLSGLDNPEVSLDFYLRSGSWHPDNYAHIWLEIDDGGSLSEITLLDTRPNDIDTLGLEGNWTNASTALPSSGVATLKWELDGPDSGNPGSRQFGVDNIRFTAVPEPSSLILALGACLGLAAAVRARQR